MVNVTRDIPFECCNFLLIEAIERSRLDFGFLFECSRNGYIALWHTEYVIFNRHSIFFCILYNPLVQFHAFSRSSRECYFCAISSFLCTCSNCSAFGRLCNSNGIFSCIFRIRLFRINAFRTNGIIYVNCCSSASICHIEEDIWFFAILKSSNSCISSSSAFSGSHSGILNCSNSYLRRNSFYILIPTNGESQRLICITSDAIAESNGFSFYFFFFASIECSRFDLYIILKCSCNGHVALRHSERICFRNGYIIIRCIFYTPFIQHFTFFRCSCQSNGCTVFCFFCICSNRSAFGRLCNGNGVFGFILSAKSPLDVFNLTEINLTRHHNVKRSIKIRSCIRFKSASNFFTIARYNEMAFCIQLVCLCAIDMTE